jgi:hypothetical protein
MKKQEDEVRWQMKKRLIYKENEGMTEVDNSERFIKVWKEVGSVMEFNEFTTN